MNLSDPFIKRPVMTTLLMLPLIFFGIFAYIKLPVSSLPIIESPTISVSCSYPGASPEEVARYVAGPLERQFMLMQGIQFVSSQNDYQSTTIVLQFHEGVNIDVAAQEVQNAIDKAAGQLPKALPNPPTYTKANPSDTPIIYLNVYSKTASLADIYEWGYTFVGQQLGTVEGIADITTYGYPYAVRVNVDTEAVASRGLSLSDIAQTLIKENPDEPTGKFYGPDRSVVTRVKGQILDAEKYNDLILKYEDGEPVRLRDVGRAFQSVQNNKSSFYWVNQKGEEDGTMFLAILKQPGFNTMKVCTAIEELCERLRQDLPGSMELNIPFTQSSFIRDAVDEVEFTLLIAFLLVVFVVYVYLGRIRNSVIPLITLPITITGTFVIMYLLGYSIDIMSMSALTLAIGFLVDDAIIVLENIVRHVELGLNPHKAAHVGSKQIIITVISISLCLCAVFIPMVFFSGTIGHLFKEFGAVMFIAILFSGFISLSLTPMLCSRFVTAGTLETKTKMERISDKLNQKLTGWYKPVLEWALKHKFWVFIFCMGNMALSIVLFLVLPREFLPDADLGVIQTFVVADPGTSPEKMNSYLDKMSVIGKKNPAVDTIGRINSFPTDNQALYFLNLKPAKERQPISKVIPELEAAFQEVVGINVFMKPFPLINLQVGNITAGKGRYQYIIQGFKEEDVFDSATKMVEQMEKYPQFSQVSSNLINNAPVLDVEILRDAAHSYSDLTAKAVENAFQYAYGETYIAKLNSPTNTYYVILEGTNDDVRDPTRLARLYTGEGEDQVAIDSVIKKELVAGPLEINRVNTLTAVTIAFNQGPNYSLSQSLEVLENIAHETLPPNVVGTIAGNTEAFKRIFTELTVLLIVAIFLIYIILGILYENFIHPITALSALPVAVLGGLVTLLVLNQTLSIYALIGLIMLIGIVMKNSIIIIDFAIDQMTEEQKGPYEAIVTACMLRFRPIIMTTFAAMMGSVPVALGVGGTIAAGRAPLGMVVVGGLLFSQIVTLFVIPAFFLFMCHLQEKIQEKFKVFRTMEDKE